MRQRIGRLVVANDADSGEHSVPSVPETRAWDARGEGLCRWYASVRDLPRVRSDVHSGRERIQGRGENRDDAVRARKVPVAPKSRSGDQ